MALPISYNVRSLVQRWRVTLLAIGGIALVVAVFATLLSMSNGFRSALRATGLEENAILVQKGSASELTSWVNRDLASRVMVDSRVARGPDGQPLASGDIVIVAVMPRRADGEPTQVTVRGVGPRSFQVRGGIRLVEGRNFTPGLYEIIVGERIRDRVRGLDLGSTVRIQRQDWKVVGIFASDGGAFESEMWGDIEVMAPLFQRRGGYNSVTLRLADPATLKSFADEIDRDPKLQHRLIEERKYYEDQAGPVAAALLGLAVFVAVVMGVGAVFGAMNTMYAIVAARTREIGTLRAVGFSRISVLLAFVLESVLLALVGGGLGCLLALPMNGFSTGTGNTAGFAEVAFAFRITPGIMMASLIFAALMGFAGGLLPALRASRLPISSALREA